MDNLWEGLRWALGIDLDPKDYNLLQISLRALVVYLGGLIILRIGQNRFLGKATAFDIVLGFILGSILSRAVNGSSPLFLTLAAAVLLVFLHFVFAWISFKTHWFGSLVKGNPDVLVRDGEIVWEGMRRHRISRRDLEEALRTEAHLEDPGAVACARLERSGEISVVGKKKEPRVLEVRVEEGVQTVRIEIG